MYLRNRKEQDAREKYVVRSLIICDPRQILYFLWLLNYGQACSEACSAYRRPYVCEQSLERNAQRKEDT